MYDTRNADAVAKALLDLTGCLNSPRQDDVLLRAANITLDRALFPILIRLSTHGPISVARLAELAGRDASTISRQLAKLEQIGLIFRSVSRDDQRLREAAITPAAEHIIADLTETRRKALNNFMADWTEAEREMFPILLQRLADAMKAQQNLAIPESQRA